MQKKRKRIAGDFIYTFAGLTLMNIVLQVIIYPLINNRFGDEYLGNVVSYIGMVYILSVPLGNACSGQRLLARKMFTTSNGDYLRIAGIFAVIIFTVYTVIMSISEGFSLSACLYGFCAVCVFYRYYSEVQFRLNLNFKQLLIYYVIVSGGYLLGYLLFLLTNQWPLIFIIGEGLAVCFVIWKGDIYRRESKSENTKPLAKLIIVLAVSYVFVFIVSQYYKIFLKAFLNAEQVTVYYVASFFGKSLDMVISPISTLIMSYLTKSTNVLSKKMFNKIILIVFGAGILLYFGFIVATPIYTKLFYHDILEQVNSLNLVVNFAQAACAMASIVSVFVLTEIGTKKHFIIQIIYVVLYVGLTSWMTKALGLLGFGIGASIAYCVRLFVTIFVGRHFLGIKEKQNEE